MNGMVQCPTCHSYFTANVIILSLPIPILRYLEQYVRDTPKANRKPLVYEVFGLLVNASLGETVELPDINPILPYLGLFTAVTLQPDNVTEFSILMPYLPSVSTIQGSTFTEAPSNILPTAENAARIFHPMAINNNTPRRQGMIPLSPQGEGFTETRYWRLPVPAAAIFAALIERLRFNSSQCEDVKLAVSIYGLLLIQSVDRYPPDNAGPSGLSGGGGPSGDGGPDGGGGPSGGGGQGGHGIKRKDIGNSPSPGKGKKQARKVSDGGNGTEDCGEPSEASDAGWNDNDSESGCSVSAINPHDEDDPATWRFGPSFSTNKIVFTAAAVNLTL